MSKPFTGAGIAALSAFVRRGIRKPLVVEAISNMAEASGDAPVSFIATACAKQLKVAPNKKNKAKSAKRFVKFDVVCIFIIKMIKLFF